MIESTEKMAAAGRCRFTCIGPSMLPILHPGDELWAEPADFTDLGVGDVLVYQAEHLQRPVVHRIVRIEDQTVYTRGDNCGMDDPAAVKSGDILGRVVTFRRGGTWRSMPRCGPSRKFLFLKSSIQVIRSALAPAVHLILSIIAALPGARRMFNLAGRPTVIELGAPQAKSWKLLYQGRIIGFRNRTVDQWQIRTLYRPFIAVEKLDDDLSPMVHPEHREPGCSPNRWRENQDMV
jgi:signal peptidase I